MRKAQVSIFIIIALALLILIGILIALASFNIRPAANDLSPQVDNLNTFVEQCLFDSTMNGLKLLGAQGGIIFEHQGGSVPDSFGDDRFTWNHSDTRVWYSIRPDSVTYGKSCATDDLGGTYNFAACPSYTFPFRGEDSDRIEFGVEATTKYAHDLQGDQVDNMRLLNRLSLPGLYESGGPQDHVAWLSSLLSPHMKIKPNLAEFIKNNITKCLDFSEFRRQGYIVEPTGGITVNPIFSEEFTKIELVMPLLLIDNSTNRSTAIKNFKVDTRVRFGKIYKYINDILSKEADDYSFNLESAEPLDGISLESLDRDLYEKEVDMVVFVDTKSVITDDGFDNFRFTGAIPNSPPVISYIHYRNISAMKNLDSFLVRYCGFVVPPTGTHALGRKAFSHMNRDIIKCIFSGYANVTAAQGKYQMAYDADDDDLTWEFKTSNCSWNEHCQYDNEYEFDNGMATELTLRFFESSRPEYEDLLTIPIKLYNYAPSRIQAECVGEFYGSYVYRVGAYNEETGPNMDPLILLPPEVSGAVTVENYEIVDTTLGWVWWDVRFSNTPGDYDVKFTVEDSFGESNSTTLPIKIPCP